MTLDSVGSMTIQQVEALTRKAEQDAAFRQAQIDKNINSMTKKIDKYRAETKSGKYSLAEKVERHRTLKEMRVELDAAKMNYYADQDEVDNAKHELLTELEAALYKLKLKQEQPPTPV